MKKYISLILAAIMLLSVMAGCGSAPASSAASTPAAGSTAVQPEPVSEPVEETPIAEKVTVRLGGLKGATSIGMVKLLEDDENGLTINDYEFTMAGAADELTPLLLKGELDVIAVPLNLGSILYNNSEGKVQLLAVNTLGVIYIVEKGGETVTDIASLKGKTIYATGKGSTPEYALKYLLAQYGLDPENDVTIEWKSEPTEIVAQMAGIDSAVAMLPQPYVTVAQGQVDGLRVALDLTELWDALDNGSQLMTAGLIVRRAFAEENPEAVAALMDEYAASTDYVNSDVADAAQLVEKCDIIKAAVAEKAIPYCNIVCITGEDMASSVKGYYEVLESQNPASIGGALPADDYYYAG